MNSSYNQQSISQQTLGMNWVYINGLGERDSANVTEQDQLTAVAFDKSGDYLAVGDRGGRVIVFRYSDLKNSRYFDYRYFTEIQSHEPEFDHLKSIELDEKINALEFAQSKGIRSGQNQSSLNLLTTNDRIIKLWKIQYKVQREITKCQIVNGQIQIPNTVIISESYEGVEKKQFKNCHNYNINSLSVCPDGTEFLSADDLRVNLWSLQNNLEAYNIVDLKPQNIEELNEVITHVEFSPMRSDHFLFSSSKGYICIVDLRMNSQFDGCAQFLQIDEDPSRKHFFTDIINSISRAKFSKVDENIIFSRNYLGVDIWDRRMNSKGPIKQLHACDYLEKKLCDVYESETIFDKFDLSISPDSNLILTGTYNSNAHVIDIQNNLNNTIDVRFMEKRGKNIGFQRNYKGKRVQGSTFQNQNATGSEIQKLDMNQRITLGDWHPYENIFAVSKFNSLFLYTNKRSGQGNK